MPHKVRLDCSVTRHINLGAKEIWGIGQGIADDLPLKPDGTRHTLYGRADISAKNVRAAKLDTISEKLPENPNHANITGWPTDKSAQKNVAQELAAAAAFVATPSS